MILTRNKNEKSVPPETETLEFVLSGMGRGNSGQTVVYVCWVICIEIDTQVLMDLTEMSYVCSL